MAVIRALATTKVTLSRTFAVDEAVTDADGDVTVTAKRLDGTTLNTGIAAHPGPVGKYTRELALPTLDILIVEWAGLIAGSNVVVRDAVEVVGGHIFDLGEVRSAHRGVRSPMAFTAATLAYKRIEVEQTCERICGYAMVPRFDRIRLSGTGREALATPRLMLRAVRKVEVRGVAFTAEQLAAVYPSESGVLYLESGWWPQGRGNIIVELEHGLDFPTVPVREAAILHMREVLTAAKTDIPDRAQSFTVLDGGVYRMLIPDAESTGIPTVDAAYHGARIDTGGL